MRRKQYLILAGLLLPLLIIFSLLNRRAERSIQILVERGQYRLTLEEAHYQEAVSDPVFVEYAIKAGLRLTGRSLTPGLYHITEQTSQYGIISMFVFGKREPLVKITIPEGFTMFQIASRLKHRAQIDSTMFVEWCQHPNVLKKYGVSSPSMDGFLMPATYFVIRSEPWDDVGSLMADESRRTWVSIQPPANVSRDSIVTLASIVQRESSSNEELATIAGVYHNRLQRGMRLEADPTLQYQRDLQITKADLRDASNLYNTYQHAGLPPGPICNPGKQALLAAMKPEVHDHLFFVARGDGSGRHRFTRTYAEHLANVKLYRARLGN
jgi:UPF0755 protein